MSRRVAALLLTLLALAVVLRPVPAASGKAEPYEMQVRVYHYALDERCTGKWTKYNKTASGTTPTPYRTIAHEWLPFGTLVAIGGDLFVVEDRGVKGNTIDIFVESYDQAKQLGTYRATMTVYPIPNADPNWSWREIASAMTAWLHDEEEIG